MKKITLCVLMSISSLGITLSAQNLVSTAPANKNAIIEEFTGVNCPNCPAGHVVVAGILAANPGRAFVVGYHPTNSNYTTPRNGTDPDFRRAYLDAFYSSAYVGSRFMPGAMINRRTWGAERMSSRGDWDSRAQTILGETSPANVGIESNYDAGNDELTVDVEVYFTSDVTDQLGLYVHLMESDLVADQSSGSATYIHKHVFREALTGQWGDDITGTTTSSDLYSTQLTFDMSTVTDVVDLDKADVMVFIYNRTSGEVITGVEVSAKGGSTIGLNEEVVDNTVLIYPNPVNDIITWELPSSFSEEVSVSIINILGKEMFRADYSGETKIESLSLTDMAMSPGIYFLRIEGKGGETIKKFMKN